MSIITLPFFLCTLQPKKVKIFSVIFISLISGTLYKVVTPSIKIVAAIIGNDAFLEPDTVKLPLSFFPPSIIYPAKKITSLMFYVLSYVLSIKKVTFCLFCLIFIHWLGYQNILE